MGANAAAITSTANVVGGLAGAYGSYVSMNSQVAAAKANAAMVRQQAEMNANMAMATAGAQASAIRGRASYESTLHDMNANISARNAMIAEQDAQSAQDRTRSEVAQADRRTRLLAGAQRAGYAKAGVTIEGTPADVMFDSALQGELEELSTLYIGNQEVRAHMIDSMNYRFSEAQQRYNADAVVKFGEHEADFVMWQGQATSAITLANGNMQAASYMSSVPASRAQGWANISSSLLQSSAAAYSMLPNSQPSTLKSFIGAGKPTLSMGIGRHT